MNKDFTYLSDRRACLPKRQVIHKIKLLKRIQPQEEWKVSNRAFLLAEIKSKFNKAPEAVSKPIKSQRDVSSLIRDVRLPRHNFHIAEVADTSQAGTSLRSQDTQKSLLDRLKEIFYPRAFVRPIAALILFFSIACGTFAMGIKSQESILGESLYPMKIAIENAELFLTSQDKKAELHTSLANRRLDEAVKLAKADEPAPAKKEKIEKTIDTFKKEIKIAEACMNEPAKDNDSSKSAEIAKNIETKTEEFERILKDIPEDLPEEIKSDIEDSVEKALVAAEEASDSALGVMIENMNGSISSSEILAKIAERIEKEKEKIAKAEVEVEEIKKIKKGKETDNKSDAEDTKDKGKENEKSVEKIFNIEEIFTFWEIKKVCAEEAKADDNDAIDANSEKALDSEEDLDKADKVIKDLGKATALLEKAKEYLEENDLETAWEFVSTAIKLVKKTEVSIKELSCDEEVFSDESEPQSEDNEGKAEENPEYIEEDLGNSEGNSENSDCDELLEIDEGVK